jgi:hypothetical protein
MNSTKLRYITTIQWTEAVKILTTGNQLGCRELSHHLQKQLIDQLRGPFAKGMSREQAVKVIDAMGWRIRDGR